MRDMTRRPLFQRLLVSLYDAALDAALWPAASELIDEVIGAKGNSLMIPAGPEGDARFFTGMCLYRGQRREDLARDYSENYRHHDDRLQLLRRLPEGRLAHVTELYTPEAFEGPPGIQRIRPAAPTGCNSLNVRLRSLDGTDFVWVVLDPVKGDWRSAQIRA